MLAIHNEEVLKRVSTVLYHPHEANLKKTTGAPHHILASVRGDAFGYADVIRCASALWGDYSVAASSGRCGARDVVRRVQRVHVMG